VWGHRPPLDQTTGPERHRQRWVIDPRFAPGPDPTGRRGGREGGGVGRKDEKIGELGPSAISRQFFRTADCGILNTSPGLGSGSRILAFVGYRPFAGTTWTISNLRKSDALQGHSFRISSARAGRNVSGRVRAAAGCLCLVFEPADPQGGQDPRRRGGKYAPPVRRRRENQRSQNRDCPGKQGQIGVLRRLRRALQPGWECEKKKKKEKKKKRNGAKAAFGQCQGAAFNETPIAASVDYPVLARSHIGAWCCV